MQALESRSLGGLQERTGKRCEIFLTRIHFPSMSKHPSRSPRPSPRTFRPAALAALSSLSSLLAVQDQQLQPKSTKSPQKGVRKEAAGIGISDVPRPRARTQRDSLQKASQVASTKSLPAGTKNGLNGHKGLKPL